MKTLIAYFSRKGNNYVNGTIRSLSVGNTKAVAEMIAKLTCGDQFEIERAIPYSEDYDECTRQALEDLKSGARPKLRRKLDSIAEYDVIYLGYPNYWGTMPVHVFLFLESYDFSGKIIMPFCTHEGSGMANSEIDIRRICPGAKVEKGLAIHGADVQRAGKAIEKWVWMFQNGGR